MGPSWLYANHIAHWSTPVRSVCLGRWSRRSWEKLPPSKRVAYEDTNVVVSVTERSKRDFTKRFDEMDVDWLLVKQVVSRR